MKKKKKGSSLIIVIVIMAILFTTGAAILTLTASDYKMRTNASKKLENLYAADSGLDIVENVILKNSEAAIIHANQKIKDTYNGKEMSSELYEKINVDFKVEFIDFLGKEAAAKGLDSKKDAMLAQGIVDGKYKVLNVAGDAFIWKVDIDKKSEIEIIKYEYDAKDSIQIEVKSTFETKDKEIKNKKILATKYTVTAPDYKEPVSSDNVAIDIYPVFDGKVITADGNLTLKGIAEIKGDIWVKGNSELGDNPAYAFDKYRGGISVENGTLNLVGNAFTNRTLNLNNLANASITGDVYALNAYVGKSDKTVISSENNLNINGNLIVNNDLSLNATRSTVNMKNFYGINDKRDDSVTDIKGNITKAMSSSSIIVNEISNESKSMLTVEDDTYIMGVAYIDTLDKKYQTGESVAVKGNYSAYADILPGYEDKVTLKYYNPLQLIETIKDESKANYFQKYYNASETNKASIKNGGVYLNKDKIYSTGAYVTKNKDVSSSVGLGKVPDNNTIMAKRNDFARNVFSMGNTNGIGTQEDIYRYGEVKRTVENQINFAGINSGIVIKETYGNLILNNDPKKTIVIKGENDMRDYSKRNCIIIDASKALKAVIITSGNVEVTRAVDFTGNIIAGGDVVLKDRSTSKNISYDENVTKKIIASNYDAVKDVLNKGAPSQQTSVNIGDKIDIKTTADGYNLKGLLKTGNWKIVK